MRARRSACPEHGIPACRAHFHVSHRAARSAIASSLPAGFRRQPGKSGDPTGEPDRGEHGQITSCSGRHGEGRVRRHQCTGCACSGLMAGLRLFLAGLVLAGIGGQEPGVDLT
jgi:hypothetical protein